MAESGSGVKREDRASAAERTARRSRPTAIMATRRTALVTGASSGVGLEMARVLAETQHDLVLVGRRKDALEAIADTLRSTHGVSVSSFAKDLSEPNAAAELWAEVGRAGHAIDILINNAGTAVYGPLADQHDEAVTRMLALNVIALTSLTRLALPAMLSRRWGRILNVASVVAYQPAGPRMAAYYASKSYVLSFSKGLAQELRGTGVSVTALCPGTMDTPFDESAGASRTILYRYVPRSSATMVARAGYRAMMRGSTVRIPGVLTKLIAFAGELPPRRIAVAVNRLLLTEV
jgi:uncharacterized protein